MHPRLQNIPLSELLSHIIDNILDRYEQIDRRWIRLEQCLGKRFRVTTLHEKENKLMEYSIYKLQYHLWELDREEENLTKSEIKLLCNDCFHQRPMIGRPNYPLPSYNEYFGYHNDEEGIAHTYDGYNCKEDNYPLPSYDEYYGYSKKEDNCSDQEAYEEPIKQIEPEMEEEKAEIIQDPEAAQKKLLEEEKREKLFKKCVKRYYIYDDRCKRLRCHLEYKDLNRIPMYDMKKALRRLNIKDLEYFLERFRSDEWRIRQLEQLHFPHVHYCYYDDDYLEKRMKRIWSGIKKGYMIVRKSIFYPIERLQSKIISIVKDHEK